MSRSFADVLDDALETSPEPAIVSRGGAAFTYQPPNPFLFTRAIGDAALRDRKPGAAVASGPSTELGAVLSQSMNGCSRTVSRLPHANSESRALDGSVTLGASLGSTFTARDLRREYRRLARHVHPDRHPFASAAERAALSRQFADLTHQYRALLAARTSRGRV